MTINTVSKYRVWCVSENMYVDGWYVEEPIVCPHNDTHTINPALTSIVERIDTSLSTDLNGKVKIHNTQRPPGTTTFFTGAADNPNIFSDVGNGQHFAHTHKVGDPLIHSDYLDFNIAENMTYITEGYVTWNDAHNDMVSLKCVPRLVTYEAGTNTNYNILGGYIVVPANGNGTVNITSDLTHPNGGLIYMPDNEFGERPKNCFWDADWNSTTNRYENIQPNLEGNGRYNMFSYEILLSNFVNKVIMSGNASQRYASNDAVRMGQGMRLKVIYETLSDDHLWYCSFLLTFYREKTT